MLKHLLIWCLAAGTLASCSGKEDAEPQPTKTATQDYIPTTAKSTWNYGGASPYSATATGATKVINGKTYYEIETKQGSTVKTSYLIKDNGVYAAVDLFPNTGSQEIIMLKENAPVGQSWEYTHTNQGVTTKIKFTLAERDISKTVEGKTYNHVIRVKTEFSFSYMGVEMGVYTTAYYHYAKGIGLIFTDLGDQGQVPLLTYDIK